MNPFEASTYDSRKRRAAAAAKRQTMRWRVATAMVALPGVALEVLAVVGAFGEGSSAAVAVMAGVLLIAPFAATWSVRL